jgi:hypothetical protein
VSLYHLTPILKHADEFHPELFATKTVQKEIATMIKIHKQKTHSFRQESHCSGVIIRKVKFY